MDISYNPLIQKELNRINMEVSEVAYAVLDKQWRYGNVCSPYSRVYCILSGEAQIFVKGEYIKLTVGNIYIIPTETTFSYSCEESMSKLYFHINILRYNNYDLLSRHGRCIILENRQEQIQALLSDYNRGDVLSIISLKSRLYSIMLDAVRQEGLSLGEIEEYSEVIKSAMAVIENDLSVSLRVGTVAERLYVSESRLQKQFKSEVGVPLGRYINDRLMIKAENLLRRSKLSVKDISDALGFCDQFYFSRRFSERFGMPPSVYRKNKVV